MDGGGLVQLCRHDCHMRSDSRRSRDGAGGLACRAGYLGLSMREDGAMPEPMTITIGQWTGVIRRESGAEAQDTTVHGM